MTPELGTYWVESTIGRGAILVDAQPEGDGWSVRLGGDATWQPWPLNGWIECDSSGTPLTPDGGTPLTD